MPHDGKYHARIYRPKHRQQKTRFDGKLIGCTETVFATLTDAVTCGGINLSESIVRAMSNEPVPDPNSPGLNLHQMDAIAAKLHMSYTNRTDKGETFPAVKKYLDQNRRIQLSIYDNVDHSIMLQAVRARPGAPAGWEILINDPRDTAAKWVTDDWIIDKANQFVHHHGGDGWWFAYSKILPYVAAGAK